MYADPVTVSEPWWTVRSAYITSEKLGVGINGEREGLDGTDTVIRCTIGYDPDQLKSYGNDFVPVRFNPIRSLLSSAESWTAPH